MKEHIKTLVINFSSIFSANAISRLIAFLYFTLIARYLGNSNMGIYGYIFVFIGIGNIIADFGINRMLIRDVARNHQLAQQYLDYIIPLRFFLSLVGFILLLGFLTFIQSDDKIAHIAPIALLAIFPYSLSQTFDGILRARENMRRSAIASITFEMSKLMTLFVVLKFNLGLSGIFWMLAISFCIYAFILGSFLHYFGIQFHLIRAYKNWRKILSDSFPFALLSVLELIHGRIDLILLKELTHNNSQVGNYFVAYRLMDVILIFPASLSIVLLPRFSRQYSQSNKISVEYRILLRLLFFTGLITILIINIFSKSVINIVFGVEYSGAVGVLRILTISMFFFFIHYANVTFLAASHLQWQILLLSLVTVSINILANLLFIPRWGMYGAAWANNISIAIGFFLFSSLVVCHLNKGISVVQTR